ncbi:40907_t:CDS:2 [Gigaspora margarita]|uniref:40907_t:CDS:1 n=1 Tax=Gigaspora margarita TaxID=4874 RepID=A0ABM8W593_GIGMA|nr:40907_t:CDS:2 [Gigaspora margarita]
MGKTFWKDVVDDLRRLYETKEGYDTIIIAGEEPDIEEIYAHALILRTRSSYFRSALSAEWAERANNGYLVLKKPNINPLTIKIIMKFLYCGMVDLDGHENEVILELLVAADEFLIQRLIDFVQEFLIKNSNKFLQQELVRMLHFIDHNDKFDEIREAYLDAICENPNLLFESDEFLTLEEDTLKLILKCDNLTMKENVIWKQLVRWGNAQRMMLENNMMDDDIKNVDINALGKILQELIKFVRFHQIDREEFMKEVWPFRSLLPETLIADILRCYLETGAIPLYNTFLVRWGNFKIDSDNIWIKTNDSFLFLLDQTNLKSATVSRIHNNHSDYAIGCDESHGPSFGDGPDLHVPNNGNIWKFKAKTYPKLGISGSLTISDYEVFQIVNVIEFPNQD